MKAVAVVKPDDMVARVEAEGDGICSRPFHARVIGVVGRRLLTHFTDVISPMIVNLQARDGHGFHPASSREWYLTGSTRVADKKMDGVTSSRIGSIPC